MFIDYTKLSDEELMKKLTQVNERLSFMGAYSNSGMAVHQLQLMQHLIQQEFSDRTQRRSMQHKIDSEPEVRDLCAEKKEEVIPDKNSRAKTKSDIIGRMRRTTKPTSIKDAD